MNSTFTLEDLTRFVYDETNLLESLEIANAIASDQELKEEYEQLAKGKQELSVLSISPSGACIDYILNFSQKGRGLEASY